MVTAQAHPKCASIQAVDGVRKVVLGSDSCSLWMYAEVWVLGVP